LQQKGLRFSEASHNSRVPRVSGDSFPMSHDPFRTDKFLHKLFRNQFNFYGGKTHETEEKKIRVSRGLCLFFSSY